MPRANTGSRLLNCVSDSVMFLLQMERRVDHWLRPPFDVTLRDPIARLVTALINMQRKNWKVVGRFEAANFTIANWS